MRGEPTSALEASQSREGAEITALLTLNNADASVGCSLSVGYVSTKFERESVKFNEYYRRMGIVRDDEEWDVLLACLRCDLPITLRIPRAFAGAERLKQSLQQAFGELQDVVKPFSLQWYPEGFAWQWDVDNLAFRGKIREGADEDRIAKHHCHSVPSRVSLHATILNETELGHIVRQEAVSMVPPLLLAPESHHHVLDLCAAPGSKTLQLLEVVRNGMVVANDFNATRTQILFKRAQLSRSTSLLVTNTAAQEFPLCVGGRRLLFDRIVCDVPCSGDGTLRKNPTIWLNWQRESSYALHPLQLKILERGLWLLKEGGILTYSTCSLNPIENEAVVSSTLRAFEGDIEVLDASDWLPGLKSIPGLIAWEVQEREAWYSRWEESPKRRNSNKFRTMYPPPVAFHEQLRRCMRFHPNQQNTGGFFVAVIRKLKPLERKWPEWSIGETPIGEKPVEETAPEEAQPARVNDEIDEIDEIDPPRSAPSERKETWVKKNMLLPLGVSERVIGELTSFFGIHADFPMDCLLARGATIYLVSNPVRDLLHAGPLGKLKPVNAGTKLFKDMPGSDTACRYRICQDGLDLILPHMSKQLVTLHHQEDIEALLEEPSVQASAFKGDQVRREIEQLQCGPCVVVHASSGVAVAARSSRGGQVAAMVSGEERRSLLLALRTAV